MEGKEKDYHRQNVISHRPFIVHRYFGMEIGLREILRVGLISTAHKYFTRTQLSSNQRCVQSCKMSDIYI